MKRAVSLLIILMLGTGMAVAAPTAQIIPSQTEAEVIPSDQDSIEIEYDGSESNSEGETIVDYQWNILETDETDSGPTGTLEFERGATNDNTIRLTVTDSNGDANSTEITQQIQDAPRVDAISGPTSLSIDEDGTFSVADEDLTNSYDNPVSYEWYIDDMTGDPDYTGASMTHSASSDFTVYVNVTDATDDLYDTASLAVSVSSDDDGSDGSSNPGGGGTAPPPTTAPPASDVIRDEARAKAVAFTGFSEGDVASVAIEKSAVGVTGLDITVGSRPNFEVTVERPDQTPDHAGELPGEAYQHLSITSNTTESVDNASINFTVDQTWLDERDAVPENVSMYRYDTAWDELTTTVRNKTPDQVTFTAESPGFSDFAIVHETATTDDGNETAAACGDGICGTNETWETCPEDCEKPQEVIDAEDAIQTAEQQVTEDDPGYETLQDAKEAFENGNYDEAASLAQDALNQQPTDTSESTVPWIPVLVVVILLLIGAGIYLSNENDLDLPVAAATEEEKEE